jgi:hypothetical protein
MLRMDSFVRISSAPGAGTTGGVAVGTGVGTAATTGGVPVERARNEYETAVEDAPGFGVADPTTTR